MAKRRKSTRTPVKRVPKRERLRMEGDPRTALERLLKAKRTRVAMSKTKFRAAHVDGMERLKAHDFKGLGDAVRRERKAIDDFAAATKPIKNIKIKPPKS